MPANGFSVGRDISLTIYTSAGVIGTAALTNFESQQMTSEIKQVLLTGALLPAYLPEGWQGTAEFTRMDDTLDDYFAGAEASYYAGDALASAQITETITNPDGSVSQFAYQNVALKLDSPGSWAGNKEVKQKISWMAARRMMMG